MIGPQFTIPAAALGDVIVFFLGINTVTDSTPSSVDLGTGAAGSAPFTLITSDARATELREYAYYRVVQAGDVGATKITVGLTVSRQTMGSAKLWAGADTTNPIVQSNHHTGSGAANDSGALAADTTLGNGLCAAIAEKSGSAMTDTTATAGSPTSGWTSATAATGSGNAQLAMMDFDQVPGSVVSGAMAAASWTGAQGNIGITVEVAASAGLAQSFTAGLSSSGVITRRTTRPITAGLGIDAGVAKNARRSLAAALSSAGSVARVKLRPVTLAAAALAPAGALPAPRKVRAKTHDASIDFAGEDQGPYYHVGNIEPVWPPLSDCVSPGDTDTWRAQLLYDTCWNTGDTGLRPDLYPATLTTFKGNVAFTDTGYVITANTRGEITDTALPAGCYSILPAGSSWTDPASGYVFTIGESWVWLRNLLLIGRLTFQGVVTAGKKTGYRWENCRIQNTVYGINPDPDNDFYGIDPNSGYATWDTCRMIARNIHYLYCGNGAGPAHQCNNSQGSIRFFCVEKYIQDCFKAGNGSEDFWLANGCERTHPQLRDLIDDPPPAGPTAYGRLVAKQSGAQNDIVYNTVNAFLLGDENVSVEYAIDGVLQPLTISVPTRAAGVLTNSLTGTAAPSGPNVRVSLATDASGNSTSTANQVIAAINAHATASLHIHAATSGGDTGTGKTVTPLFTKNDGTAVNMLLLETPANSNGGIPHSDTFQIGQWQQTGAVPVMNPDGTIIDNGERFTTDPTYPGRLGTCAHRRFTYQGNHAGVFLQAAHKNKAGAGVWPDDAATSIVLDQNIIHTENKFMELSDSISCGSIDSDRTPDGSRFFPSTPTGHVNVENRILGTDSRANPPTGGYIPDGAINGPPYSVPLPPSSGSGARVVAALGKAHVASLSTVGALRKMSQRRILAGVTFTGAVQRVTLFHKALTAALTPAGSLARASVRVVGPASLAATGALLRAGGKNLAATITPAGVLARARSRSTPLAASLGLAGVIAKQTLRALPGAALTPAGVMVKRLSRSLAATFAPAGALLQVKVGALAKQLTATLGFAGTQTRRTGKTLTATLAPAGILGRVAQKPITAVLALGGVVTRTTSRAVAATLGLAATLDPLKRLAVVMTATLDFAGGFAHTAQKTITATLGLAGAVPLRRQARSLVATITPAGLLERSTAHLVAFAASLPLAGILAHRVQIALGATLSLAGGIGRGVQRTINAALNPTGFMQTVWTSAGAAKRSLVVFDAEDARQTSFDAEQGYGGWDA